MQLEPDVSEEPQVFVCVKYVPVCIAIEMLDKVAVLVDFRVTVCFAVEAVVQANDAGVVLAHTVFPP